MNSLKNILENWVQINDDSCPLTIADFPYSTGVTLPANYRHCEMCVTINKCWFKDEPNKIPQAQNYDAQAKLNYILSGKTVGLYHYGCHCKKTEISPNGVEDIEIIVPKGKEEFLYKDKGEWLCAMGYTSQYYKTFFNLLLQKTREAYFFGKYNIICWNKYGCKVNVELLIPGINGKTGHSYKLKSGCMIFPNGQLKLNTPIGGWYK